MKIGQWKICLFLFLPFYRYRHVAVEQIAQRWRRCSFVDCWKQLGRRPWGTWVPGRCRCRRSRRRRTTGPWSSRARRPWVVAARRRRTPFCAGPEASTRRTQSPRRSGATAGSAPACPWSSASSRTGTTYHHPGCMHQSAAALMFHPKIKFNISNSNQTILYF